MNTFIRNLLITLAVFIICGLGGYIISTQLTTVKQETSAYTMTCKGVFTKTCTVHFREDVKTADTYKPLLAFLGDRSSSDKVTFYVMGNGGYVYSLLALYYAIQNTAANTTTVVIGDSYSAHAALAVAGKNIKVLNPSAVIMFHRSSLYSLEDPVTYCVNKHGKGTDRRQLKALKCVQYFNAFLKQDTKAVKQLYKRILTPAEIKLVLEGHDVFITGAELQKRLTES